MPRSRTQNEKMRAATQTAVLNSAMLLFAQNGYAHTTTRAIAEEAGISIGLMYHYYNSKEALLQAVFDHCITILSRAFTDSYVRSAPQQRLKSLLQTMFGMLAREENFWSLFYMLRTQPTIMRLLGDDFRLWTRRLRKLFAEELQLAGSPTPILESYLLYSLVEGTIQQFLLDPDSFPLAKIEAAIIEKFTGEKW